MSDGEAPFQHAWSMRRAPVHTQKRGVNAGNSVVIMCVCVCVLPTGVDASQAVCQVSGC